MLLNEYATKLDENREPVLYKVREVGYSEKVDGPKSAVDAANFLFGLEDKAEEYVYLFCLDVKGGIKGVMEIGHGGLNACMVDARNVFSKALLLGTSKILLVHNHVSGNLVPSRADLEVAAKIKGGGEILDMELLDFIIVGKGCYKSFLEDNILADLKWGGNV